MLILYLQWKTPSQQNPGTMATTTTTTIIISLIYASAAAIASSSSPTTYLIGLGSRDITGPAADVNMMGYANPTQTAAGIHIRLHARTFIVAEAETNITRRP